jgi:hypothetical protein
MNVGALATRFFTLAEASEELTILLLLCQACSNSVQTPSNFLTCKHADYFLWISDQLVTFVNTHISAYKDKNS